MFIVADLVSLMDKLFDTLMGFDTMKLQLANDLTKWYFNEQTIWYNDS